MAAEIGFALRRKKICENSEKREISPGSDRISTERGTIFT
jgi:hypothetical protein